VLEHNVLSSRSADNLAHIGWQVMHSTRESSDDTSLPVIASELDAWHLGGIPRKEALEVSATWAGALWSITALGGSAEVGVTSTALGAF
jgi:hypothetical protein